MEPPATALVVEPSVPETLFLISSLSDLGFQVSVTDNFIDARTGLMSAPALLVTELRLGEYNGLHLVFRAKSIRSDMAAIIRTQIADPLLQLEAERMGATFVLKTTSPEELRAAVARTLLRRSDSFEPIRPPFERRHRERREVPATNNTLERRVGERRVDIRKRVRERRLYPSSNQALGLFPGTVACVAEQSRNPRSRERRESSGTADGRSILCGTGSADPYSCRGHFPDQDAPVREDPAE